MGALTGDTTTTGVPSARAVFAAPGFLAVFVASSLSTWGDYIARLTIAWVVFDRTGSALATAATFAVSLMPTLLGRGLLSGLADRFPYRDVLVASHQMRALLAVLLLLGVWRELPVGYLLGGLFLLELCAGPAVAANQILLTDWFPDRRLYARAFGLNTLSNQVNQAIGFVLGGSIVALTGPHLALGFDVVTFVLVVAVLLLVVRRRPPPAAADGRGLVGDLVGALRALSANRVLVALLGLSVVSVPAIAAPEAVAIPYAAAQGWPDAWRGLLLAAPVTGAVLGVLVLGRLPATRQLQLMLPMALAMPVPLLLTLTEPPVAVLWLTWFAAGVLQTFMLPLQACYSLVVPNALRGRLFGLAGALSVAVTGVAFLFAGWVSGATTPTASVVVCAVMSLSGIVLVRSVWPATAVDRAVDAAYTSRTGS